MGSTDLLKAGYRNFRKKYFKANEETYHELVKKGQRPKTLLISCSDSRVDPSIIMQTPPGELFTIRNVGNLVPPYEPSDDQYHGVSSALEYGVKILKVENIIIMGHAHCGAIQAAIDTEGDPESLGTEFLHHWVDIAQEVFKAPQCCSASIHSGNRIPEEIEQASIVNSMNNLQTFPFVQEQVASGSLRIYGIYFQIETGKLTSYDKKLNRFISV